MDPKPIGRDAEIAAVLAFLSADVAAPNALAIIGDPGIGKTTLWTHLVLAVSRSSRVLSCRPALPERPLAFSALDDLIGDVASEVLPELEWPRRRAVEAALLLGTASLPRPADRPEAERFPEQRLLARAVLDVLRLLAAEAPLMVAVDDAQWLDRPSAAVLAFCLRRLQREPVSILFTCRPDGPLPLGVDSALPCERVTQLPLGPLSVGAIGQIVQARLQATFPRYILTRLHESCGGNPLYALEAARTLLDHPSLSLSNEPLPIPRSLSGLVRRRLGRLTPAARRVCHLLAASSDPRERLIRAACDDEESWAPIDQAIDAGIIERKGEELRFTHPLLRSAFYGEMTLDERRNVHRRLAATDSQPEAHAWHLALGADRPSQELAVVLDKAALHAASRGAPGSAAALAEQARRLTPATSADSAYGRTLCAADYHFRAGEIRRSRDLIQAALDGCPAGPFRARLLIRLATIQYHETGWQQAEQLLRQVAKDSHEDAGLRAHAEQDLAIARLLAGDLPDAARWAASSLNSAEQAADPCLTAHSLARIAVLEFFQGKGMPVDLIAKAEALDRSGGAAGVARIPTFGPTQVRGLLLKWRDELDAARLCMKNQYRRALDIGDEASRPYLLHHLSELECWAGNWHIAEEYALEGCQAAEECQQQAIMPATLYSLALVRAHRGQVEESRGVAGEALDLCEKTGNVPVASQVVSVLGFLALSIGDYQAAHSHLSRLAEMIADIGLGEPSVLKFLPDQIEALAAVGEVQSASSLTQQLEARGRSLERPWAQATGARCRAQLAAITGDLQNARVACQQALSRHEQLPMPFELGRTLLVKGMIERRAKHKTAARDALGQALDIFERLGAPLWAAKARRELSKFATCPAPDALTETENRVAGLISQGRTNREIASLMFVTENTVQTHIRHIFRKLGVKSRTELAARLLATPATTATARRSPSPPP